LLNFYGALFLIVGESETLKWWPEACWNFMFLLGSESETLKPDLMFAEFLWHIGILSNSGWVWDFQSLTWCLLNFMGSCLSQLASLKLSNPDLMFVKLLWLLVSFRRWVWNSQTLTWCLLNFYGILSFTGGESETLKPWPKGCWTFMGFCFHRRWDSQTLIWCLLKFYGILSLIASESRTLKLWPDICWIFMAFCLSQWVSRF